MLIYGNTPKDIVKMMFRNKTKVLLLAGAVVLAVSLGTNKAVAEDTVADKIKSVPTTVTTHISNEITATKEYQAKSWDWHVESCESNRSYDGTINKVGTFAILEQAKIDAGGIPCPVGHPRLHPSWDYDWKAHILFAEADRLLKELHQQRQNQYGPQAGPQATRIQYKVE